MKHIASVSFGKDSLAMLLLLIEKNCPLDEVVFYDTGKEFQAIYNLRDVVKGLLHQKGILFTELKPRYDFDYLMFDHQTKSGKSGYGWCGGICRWGTYYKTEALDKVGSIKEDVRYIGIAVDEPDRLEKERKGNKLFPLAEWGMTEQQCLDYCYSKGYHWLEEGIELYSILDRVSCWCCRNKNLKELKNIYMYLPKYWARLKDLQSRTDRPMKGTGKSVFDLEKRFEMEIKAAKEAAQ